MPEHLGTQTLATAERRTEELDPEQFATRVRALAMEARRVLKDPMATDHESFEISRQLEALHRQRRRQNAPESALDLWLRNVARQIRACRPAIPAPHCFSGTGYKVVSRSAH